MCGGGRGCYGPEGKKVKLKNGLMLYLFFNVMKYFKETQLLQRHGHFVFHTVC